MMTMAGSSLATHDIDRKERGSATGSLLLLMFSLQTALFPLRYAISLICFFFSPASPLQNYFSALEPPRDLYKYPKL
ncbi:hypothetical protein ACN42_g9727 [Penicillium freii]|uniref:Uncharacterized protein n=1 Tax=Penicillium freii TaxID=48697 RepID=A0A124GQA0_PENFR|nr:hypothetical protein ACN42_g9727 [Penicillium freii]